MTEREAVDKVEISLIRISRKRGYGRGAHVRVCAEQLVDVLVELGLLKLEKR